MYFQDSYRNLGPSLMPLTASVPSSTPTTTSDGNRSRSVSIGQRAAYLLLGLAAFAFISMGVLGPSKVRDIVGFATAQYEQNVAGRVISRAEYVQQNVATNDELEQLLQLNTDYTLTERHMQEYEDNGFVVLENFLDVSQAQALEKVVDHNLEQLAFPDFLTSCSRKFHGELYHSSVSWQFWQQPRISNMLSNLALGGQVPYMITSEILEMRTDQEGSGSCIPQWHWDFLTFPETFNVSHSTGTQIWMSLTERVDADIGGGLAFMPGSHKWANSIDKDAAPHPCFVMNLFEPQSPECVALIESEAVVPTLNAGDIVVFSRFTLHRSVSRHPSHPFESTRRLGYTLRVGSASSIFKKETMSCFPSHPSANFAGQLENGQRFDSAVTTIAGPAADSTVYRPMNHVDSEEMILQSKRGMSLPRFLWYSMQSTYRQKVSFKALNWIEQSVNHAAGSRLLDISCHAAPTPDY